MSTRSVVTTVAAVVFSVGVASGTAVAMAHTPASCVGPAMPGHVAARMVSGTSITGTNGANGLGLGDVYSCRNGVVTVH